MKSFKGFTTRALTIFQVASIDSAQLSAWHTSIEEEELFNNSLKAYMRACVNIAYLYFKTVGINEL